VPSYHDIGRGHRAHNPHYHEGRDNPAPTPDLIKLFFVGADPPAFRLADVRPSIHVHEKKSKQKGQARGLAPTEEPLLLGHEYFRIRGLTAGGAFGLRASPTPTAV